MRHAITTLKEEARSLVAQLADLRAAHDAEEPGGVRAMLAMNIKQAEAEEADVKAAIECLEAMAGHDRQERMRAGAA